MSGEKSYVGKEFTSFKKVKEWIDKLEEADYKFSIASSTTTKGTKVKGPFADGLKYYEIYYRCSRAGTFKTKGGGIRNYKSGKTGCPAFITMRAKNKVSLQIIKCKLTHLHDKDSDNDFEKSDDDSEASRTSLVHLDLEKSNEMDSSNICDKNTLRSETGRNPTLDIETVQSEAEGTSEPAIDNSHSEGQESPEPGIDTSRSDAGSNPTQDVSTPPSEAKEKAEPSINMPQSGRQEKPEIVVDTPQQKTRSSKRKLVEVENKELSTIVLPPKQKKKGRPKTHTVIGLPRGSRVRKFSALSAEEKIHKMLSWLIDSDSLQQVLRGERAITKKDVQLANIKDSFLEESVDIALCKSYMDAGTFKAFKRTVENRREKDNWKCPRCNAKERKDNLLSPIILCDACVRWYHRNCTTLKKNPPKKSPWFCDECKKQV